MMRKRMTKADRPNSLGAFKPVGYVVVALQDDQLAAEAVQALHDAGFDNDDILQYSAAETGAQMDHMLDHASEFAGFGYEITLMRRYRSLAQEGCSWLLVYAPDEPHTVRVTEIAQRLGAPLAEKYHWLAVEDLI